MKYLLHARVDYRLVPKWDVTLPSQNMPNTASTRVLSGVGPVWRVFTLVTQLCLFLGTMLRPSFSQLALFIHEFQENVAHARPPSACLLLGACLGALEGGLGRSPSIIPGCRRRAIAPSRKLPLSCVFTDHTSAWPLNPPWCLCRRKQDRLPYFRRHKKNKRF